MAATALGNALTTKVERKDSKKKSRTLTGNGAEYRYTQKVGTAVSETLGAADPADATIVLREINFDPNPGGGYETVTLVYAPPNPMNWQSPPPVTVTYETDANDIEIPIQQHPNYDAGNSVLDEAGNLVTAALNPGGLKPGVTSYIVPQPTFTRTEVLSSFTFSEANIILNVGKRIAPTGMTSPTTSAWLKTRLSIRKNGNVVEKSESWQYASGLWDADIYPAGT
jgi:hypothetical protein